MASHYEAYTIVEGAMEDSQNFAFERDAFGWIHGEIEECALQGISAEGYILPHFHGEEFDGECICAQYMQDHNPIVTTDDVEADNAGNA